MTELPDDAQVIADGLAILSSTAIEMGESTSEVRAKLIGQWELFGRPKHAFSSAVDAFRTLPQPPVEPWETTERMGGVRKQLGVTSAEDQLLAQLTAREILQSLAEEFG